MSETLGYVLVFALVIGTVGVVYASGISGIQNAQQEEKLRNVERAFEVLADNTKDLHERGVPSRATEVKLRGGSLELDDTVSVTVHAEADSDPANNATYTASVQPIAYREDGRSLVTYSTGAVFRQGSSGAALVVEPEWVIERNRSTIPLVSTYGEGGGISGDGAVLIVKEARSRSLQAPFVVGNGDTARVNVTVTSPRVGSWKRFFEDEGFDPVDPNVDHDNVTYQFRTDRLYVSKTDVEVSFDR